MFISKKQQIRLNTRFPTLVKLWSVNDLSLQFNSSLYIMREKSDENVQYFQNNDKLDSLSENLLYVIFTH